jgi:PAS domain-containing protein
MRRICAWCGADLDGGGPAVAHGEPISHGICGSCRSALHTGGWTLRKFLEKLPEPVLLVTPDVVVEAANAAACAAVGKQFADMEGRLGGAVLECAYARLPGGCGKTVHCAACQIRASVGHTFRTGEALLRIDAYQDVLTLHGLQRRRLVISTEKVSEMILLRVDSIETLPQQEGDRPGG